MGVISPSSEHASKTGQRRAGEQGTRERGGARSVTLSASSGIQSKAVQSIRKNDKRNKTRENVAKQKKQNKDNDTGV